jgi:protein-disulfide isomerase
MVRIAPAVSRGLGLLAAVLLAGSAGADDTNEPPLPGVDTSSLGPAQLEVVKRVAHDAFCYCGCPHSLAGCLRGHATCKHAPRMAAFVVRLAALDMSADDILKALLDYYASFPRSKRAKLDVKAFGPPLGNPEAKVTLVEFSDFTCPFCQALRPELERFVKDHEDRVRLYYKPFPISSHPRAKEAAITAEWARDSGFFWKMHDLLFEHPHALSDSDLASYAADVGGDPDDLAAALAKERDEDRIAASQAEARAAGLRGTPTLYINGRRLDMPAGPGQMYDLLTATLGDEEEWTPHERWDSD